MSDKSYDKTLEQLQVALVRWQQVALERGDKVLVIFEGRDAAGKDGAIKRIVEGPWIRAARGRAEGLGWRRVAVVFPALREPPSGGRRARDLQPLLVQSGRR